MVAVRLLRHRRSPFRSVRASLAAVSSTPSVRDEAAVCGSLIRAAGRGGGLLPWSLGYPGCFNPLASLRDASGVAAAQDFDQARKGVAQERVDDEDNQR